MPTRVWFFTDMELSFMKLYSLAVNQQEICSVEIESPAWLPVRPRVPKVWLASIVAQAWRRCFLPPVYLECHDRSTSSATLN